MINSRKKVWLRASMAGAFLYLLTLIPSVVMQYAVLGHRFHVAAAVGFHTVYWCVTLLVVAVAVAMGRR